MGNTRDNGGEVSGQAGSGLLDGFQSLYDSAAAGHFTVSGEGGAPLLVTINRFKEWMNDQTHKLANLSERPPLGQLEGGKVLAPFMVDVATDGDGFATRFEELRDALTKAEEAIRLAIDNYQALDADEQIRYLRMQRAVEANRLSQGPR